MSLLLAGVSIVNIHPCKADAVDVHPTVGVAVVVAVGLVTQLNIEPIVDTGCSITMSMYRVVTVSCNPARAERRQR